MSSRRRYRIPGSLTVSLAHLLVYVIVVASTLQPSGFASTPQDTARTIVSDDFTRNRPKATTRRNSARRANNPSAGESSSGRRYRLASESSAGVVTKSSLLNSSQLGLTIWKLRPGVRESRSRVPVNEIGADTFGWIAERVEADTGFRRGDRLSLSIESPRAGYLYLIDRDWFTDGSLSLTKLIFPIRGDNNLLQAGRLIDIPAEGRPAMTAEPGQNQAGEMLTIIVTSSPLRLALSDQPMPIADTRLSEWEEMWGGTAQRYEMEGGAGQVRTIQEQQAATSKGMRQLSRNDPPPQTIYLVKSKKGGAFLFNVKLSYLR